MKKTKLYLFFGAFVLVVSGLFLLKGTPAYQEFNEACYLDRYPEVVVGWTQHGGRAVDHWAQYGYSHNRIPGCNGKDLPSQPERQPAQSQIFNEACYLQRYPDLATWIQQGGRAIDHWTRYGQNENRIPGCDNTPASSISPFGSVFNEACYLNRYPDVVANWTNLGGRAVDHWTKHGKSEGRIPGCDVAPSPQPSQNQEFNEACYLQRYPDLATWIQQGGRAIDHWTKYGQKENRIPGCDAGGSVNDQPHQISGPGNSPIRVAVSPVQFAGAVSSLIWNDLEFINNFDHGRQLQTAIQIDGYGECNNPTEAGSQRDDKNPTSTSKLLSLNKNSSASLTTKSQMALWAFGFITGACTKGIDTRLRSPLSDHFLEKTITVGAVNDPQIIHYAIKVTHGENTFSQKVVYEFLTGYLNTEFSRFLYSRISTGTLHDFENYESLVGQGFPAGSSFGKSQKDMFDPVILSTSSGSHAMGVYIPKSSITKCGSSFHGYNVYKFNLGGAGTHGKGTNKWSLALEDAATSPCIANNVRNFEVYLAIGSLLDVHAKLLLLSQKYP